MRSPHYGLRRPTRCNIVIAAHSAGSSSCASSLTQRPMPAASAFNVARPRALAYTVSRPWRSRAQRSAPRPSRRAPAAAAAATRDLVADGTIGKLDLDIVRAAVARHDPTPTRVTSVRMPRAHANADGCTDVVDLQATCRRTGRRVSALRRRERRPDGDTPTLTAIINAPVAAPRCRAVPGLTFVVTSTADTPDANEWQTACAPTRLGAARSAQRSPNRTGRRR